MRIRLHCAGELSKICKSVGGSGICRTATKSEGTTMKKGLDILGCGHSNACHSRSGFLPTPDITFVRLASLRRDVTWWPRKIASEKPLVPLLGHLLCRYCIQLKNNVRQTLKNETDSCLNLKFALLVEIPVRQRFESARFPFPLSQTDGGRWTSLRASRVSSRFFRCPLRGGFVSSF